ERAQRSGAREELLDLGRELVVRGGQHRGQRDPLEPVAGVHDARPAPAHDLAQAAPRAIALHRAADAAAAGDESDAGGLARAGQHDQDAATAANRGPALLDRGVVVTRTKPALQRETLWVLDAHE